LAVFATDFDAFSMVYIMVYTNQNCQTAPALRSVAECLGH
jgi:hypothetical protein